MDAKPDELVIALGSRHVARILAHLHEHAVRTNIDFEDVVPGISSETCLKVWEKCKNDASAAPITIRSQVQPTEPLHIKTAEQHGSLASKAPVESKTISSARLHAQQNDRSDTTLPRSRESEGESDCDDSVKVCGKHSRRSPSNSTDHFEDGASVSERGRSSRAHGGGDEKPVKKDLQGKSMPPLTMTFRDPSPRPSPKHIYKRNYPDEKPYSASQPAPSSKRHKVATIRRAPTPKDRKPCSCKHMLCYGLDTCLVPTS